MARVTTVRTSVTRVTQIELLHRYTHKGNYMKKTSRLAAFVAVAVAAALVASPGALGAAKGKGKAKAKAKGKPAVTKPAVTTAPAAQTTAPAPQTTVKAPQTTVKAPAATGGKLTVGIEAESTNYIPSTAWAVSGQIVATSIYDRMMELTEKGLVECYTCQSIDTTDNGVTWTMKLKSNIKFHNGEDFNADAVIGDIRYKQNPASFSNGIFTAFILPPTIKTMDKVDDLTVRFNMTGPWVNFPVYLTGQIGETAAPACYKNPQQCAANPIGTGAFKFKEWVPDDHFTAVKNDAYWRKGFPLVDQVTFKPIPDEVVRINALKSGDIDMISTFNGAKIAEMRDLKKDGKIAEADSDAFGEATWVALNNDKAPLNDKRVRCALAMLTDQEELIKIKYRGALGVANGPFGPGNLGYGAGDLTSLGYPAPNVDKAKALIADYLAEKGLKELPTIDLGTTSVPDNIDVTAFIAQQWKSKAGINTKQVNTEQAKYITDILLPGNFMATGLRGYSGQDPEVNNVFWNSLTFAPSGAATLNIQRIKNPIIDDALSKLRTNSDPALRTRYAKAIATEFNENCYNVWLYRTTWGVGAQKGVSGFADRPLLSGAKSPSLVAGYFWVGAVAKA